MFLLSKSKSINISPFSISSPFPGPFPTSNVSSQYTRSWKSLDLLYKPPSKHDCICKLRNAWGSLLSSRLNSYTEILRPFVPWPQWTPPAALCTGNIPSRWESCKHPTLTMSNPMVTSVFILLSAHSFPLFPEAVLGGPHPAVLLG